MSTHYITTLKKLNRNSFEKIMISVDSSCFGVCPLISTEQSTMAHTFAIVETYSFTKAYLKGV